MPLTETQFLFPHKGPLQLKSMSLNVKRISDHQRTDSVPILIYLDLVNRITRLR
jgi:hypothetical protein